MNLRGPRGGQACLGALAVCSMLSIPMLHAAPAATALTRFEQGSTAFQGRRWEAALKAFQASLELEGSPNTRFMIGRCLHELGRIGSAYVAYRRASLEAEDRIRATGDARYTATRDAARAKMAEIDARVPRLTIQVLGEIPTGFYVSVDGIPLAAAGLGVPLELDVGDHQIIASGPRVQRIERRVHLELGQRQDLQLSLQRIETATIQFVFHNRPSGALINLDNAAVSPDLAEKPQYVSVGEHRIDVSAPGYRALSWQEPLRANDVVQLPVHFLALPSWRRTPKWLFFATLGASLALVGAGIGVGVQAQNAEADQLALNPLERDPGVRLNIQHQALAANALVGSGGAVALIAGVLAFTTAWRPQPAAQFQLRPTPGLPPPQRISKQENRK